MNIILLSGGSGKRLWPLSNESMSKQFLRLLRDDKGNKESMVQRVFRQIKETNLKTNIVIGTNNSQVDVIKEELGEDIDIVVEPSRRNTYPAILLSCSYLKFKKNIKDDDSIIVLPVDPYTENSYFETLKKMDEVIKTSNSDITLMGIKPTYPSEKYGYMVCGNDNKVIKFKEKPTLDEAKELLKEGAYWNAGVFGFKMSFIEKYLNENNINSYEDALNKFNELKINSFDYEVVEKTNSINMVKYDGMWKDLGTWNTLTEEMPSNHGSVITGEDNNNVSVVNVTDKPVVALGLKDVVIVTSREGVLVSNKEKSSYLKKYVDDLNDTPLFEKKSFGEYQVLEKTNNSLTKHIYMLKDKFYGGECINNNEVFVIVNGECEMVINNGSSIFYKKGDTITINSNETYKIMAKTNTELISVTNFK